MPCILQMNFAVILPWKRFRFKVFLILIFFSSFCLSHSKSVALRESDGDVKTANDEDKIAVLSESSGSLKLDQVNVLQCFNLKCAFFVNLVGD